MWVCLNCKEDFFSPNKIVKPIGGFPTPVAVCPYCGDENIIDDEEYDFDDKEE